MAKKTAINQSTTKLPYSAALSVLRMSSNNLLQIVEVVFHLLPVVIVVSAVYFLPSNKGYLFKASIGIAITWVSLVLYTIYVYNPVGISAGYESGMHFPESKYDNNTIAPILFFGWLSPTAIALILFFVLKFFKPNLLNKQ